MFRSSLQIDSNDNSGTNQVITCTGDLQANTATP